MSAPIVMQLSRYLDACPEQLERENISLRTYAGTEDIEPWLELRKAAFADLKLGVREWRESDFEGEFLRANWWNPQQMWLAECEQCLVGSATLAMRGSGETAKPVIHWMMVHPQWQRRGVGQQLAAKLEAEAWVQGYRQIFLETHVSWHAAVAFYESLGYVAR